MLSAQDASTRGYLDRVKLIRKKSDAEAVQKLMADIDAEWGAKKDAAYYYVILELCGAVSSWPALDPNRTNLVRKLAITVLDAPGDKPIYSEARLLLFLQGDPDYIQRKLVGSDWEKERLLRVHRWLTTWQHLRFAKSQLPLDPGLPVVNVKPPSGGKGAIYPGMDPADIKDPIIRKQYEDAIAKNLEKGRVYRQKRALENTEDAFIKPATRYIINAYSAPPFKTEELEQILEESAVEKDVRVAIVTEVKKREAAWNEREAKMPSGPPKMMIKPGPDPPGPGPHHADLRLRKRVSFNIPSPKVEEILEKLRQQTGVKLTRADNIQNKYWATGSAGPHEVPAWEMMDILAAYPRVQGHWEKDGDGYRLVGKGDPVVLPEEKAAEKAKSWWIMPLAIIASFTLILVVGAIFIWRRARLRK
jgi:hypothetical protein